MYWPKLAEDAKEMQQACESCSAPITNYVEAFVGETGNLDWREPFIEYLNTRALPQIPSEAAKVKIFAKRFKVEDGKLYKRRFDGS